MTAGIESMPRPFPAQRDFDKADHDMPAHHGDSAQRLASIDAFRSIAIMAVIVIHTQPFWAERFTLGEWPALIINQMARFAVPFFFIISGFFVAKGITPVRPARMVVRKQARRIAIILLFWSLAYLVLIPDFMTIFSAQSVVRSVYWNLQGLLQHPVQLAHQSTRVHLWFLVAMLECLLFAMLWQAWLPKIGAGWWIFPFYLMGMIISPYSHSGIGEVLHPWLPNFPWTEVSLFMIGWWLQISRLSYSFAWAVGIAVAGLALHFMEIMLIYHLYGTPIKNQDMVFGTSLWAAGIVMALLARPQAFKSTWLEKTGKYTLGIYAIHLAVLDVLNYFGKGWEGIAWTIILPISVFIVSLLLVRYLSVTPWLKGLVV
jgi:surface polysaccharide O-acyltransferase-like enzyme